MTVRARRLPIPALGVSESPQPTLKSDGKHDRYSQHRDRPAGPKACPPRGDTHVPDPPHPTNDLCITSTAPRCPAWMVARGVFCDENSMFKVLE